MKPAFFDDQAVIDAFDSQPAMPGKYEKGSGFPIYKATMSAKQSTFRCHGCGKEVNTESKGLGREKTIYMLYKGHKSIFKLRQQARHYKCPHCGLYKSFNVGPESFSVKFSSGFIEDIIKEWISCQSLTFSGLASQYKISESYIKNYVDSLIEKLDRQTIIQNQTLIVIFRFYYDKSRKPRCCICGWDDQANQFYVLGFLNKYDTPDILDFVQHRFADVKKIQMALVDLHPDLPIELDKIIQNIWVDGDQVGSDLREILIRQNDDIPDPLSLFMKEFRTNSDIFTFTERMRKSIRLFKSLYRNDSTEKIFLQIDKNYPYIANYYEGQEKFKNVADPILKQKKSVISQIDSNRTSCVKEDRALYRVHKRNSPDFQKYKYMIHRPNDASSTMAEMLEPFNVFVLRTFYDNENYKRIYASSVLESGFKKVSFPDENRQQYAYAVPFDEFIASVYDMKDYEGLLQVNRHSGIPEGSDSGSDPREP